MPGSLGKELSNPQGRDPYLFNRQQGRRDEGKNVKFFYRAIKYKAVVY